jgi:hypothetical protein
LSDQLAASPVEKKNLPSGEREAGFGAGLVVDPTENDAGEKIDADP